jgi:hypothetical protein
MNWNAKIHYIFGLRDKNRVFFYFHLFEDDFSPNLNRDYHLLGNLLCFFLQKKCKKFW